MAGLLSGLRSGRGMLDVAASAGSAIAAGVPSIIASRLTEDFAAVVVEDFAAVVVKGGCGPESGAEAAGGVVGSSTCGSASGTGANCGATGCGTAAVSGAGGGVAEPSGVATVGRSGFLSGRGIGAGALVDFAWRDLLDRDLASSVPGTSVSGAKDAQNTNSVTAAPRRLISLVDRSGLRDPARRMARI